MTETKTRQSIKSVVKEHYDALELSTDQLERLQQMQAEWESQLSPQEKLQTMKAQLISRSSGSTPSEKIFSIQENLDPGEMPSISSSYQYPRQLAQRRSSKPLFWAAVFLVLGGVFAAFWYMKQKPQEQRELSPALLRAVTSFHQQEQRPSLLTDSVTVLRKRLTQVDFNPVHSTHLPASQWQLLGASTTTYHKQKAVVLHYHHRRTKKRYTLHQMAPWTELSRLKQAWTGHYKQQPIKVWQERGLLLLLVGP